MKDFIIKALFMLSAGIVLILSGAPLWGAIIGSWISLITLETYRP